MIPPGNESNWVGVLPIARFETDPVTTCPLPWKNASGVSPPSSDALAAVESILKNSLLASSILRKFALALSIFRKLVFADLIFRKLVLADLILRNVWLSLWMVVKFVASLCSSVASAESSFWMTIRSSPPPAGIEISLRKFAAGAGATPPELAPRSPPAARRTPSTRPAWPLPGAI